MEKQTVQVRRSVALVALSAAILIGSALAWAIGKSNSPVLGAGREVTLRLASASPAVGPANFSQGFADVVEPLMPAVVNISSSKMVKTQQGGDSPFGEDPFFRQFFGNPNGGAQKQPREQREHSLGSGVVVSADGYIITNNHVVEGASDVEVSLKDRRQFKAKVIGTDPRTNVAVLKIAATGLSSVTIGDSAKTRVGDIVLAIGDPFGIGETVTMGIVSATSRHGLDIEGPEGYEDFIQTDAAINPGNSGGALVNTRGELIGINTAIISNGGGGNQGIGFAIPVAMAKRVMEQLVSTGKVSRGYLGVSIQEVTPQLQKAFGLPSDEGALVGDVTPDSPGAKAGLQKGDVLTAINGQTVVDYHDLRLRISQIAPGTAVKLDVYRNGKKQETTVTLAEFPEKAQKAEASDTGDNAALEGVQVSALTSDMADQLSLPAGTRGVVVTQVDPDSAAAEAGLQRGDLIQEIGHKPIANMDQFRAATKAAGSDPVLLLVNRQGVTSYAVIAPR